MQLEISLFTKAKENINIRSKTTELLSAEVEKSMTVGLEALLPTRTALGLGHCVLCLKKHQLAVS